MATFSEYGSEALLMDALAVIVAGQLADAVAKRGRATLAVPGGTTPAPFLRALSRATINWSVVSVVLTDERFVPETSDRSNTRLLRENLFSGPAAAANMIPFYQNADAPEDVLGALLGSIRAVLPIDVCVLGMGEDMHIASMFPGADRLLEALDPAGDAILLPMRAPGAPEPRLTLTAPVLQAASHLHLLITGKAKKAAFHKAEEAGKASDAPVRAILGREDLVVHYADKNLG